MVIHRRRDDHGLIDIAWINTHILEGSIDPIPSPHRAKSGSIFGHARAHVANRRPIEGALSF